MHTWEGKLNLWGRTTRGGRSEPGEEVHVRIVVRPDVAPEIDVRTGFDAFGQPRWRVGDATEFDAWSFARALAMRGA